MVLFEDGVPTDFSERIAALGGSVVRVHPEIDVAIVTGLTDDAATQLALTPTSRRHREMSA